MIKIEIEKKFPGNPDMLISMEEEIREGEFVVLHGPSGAGKTSVLRMLAGLLKPDRGSIVFSGEPWFDHQEKTNIPVQKRGIGFVFQDYALFPNMTVRQNLTFALEKGQDVAIIEMLIDRTELTNFRNEKPRTLSGGQQQRLALARALVRKPGLLLLDEPFSAVDRPMRFRLRDLVMDMHQDHRMTTILVTHDKRKIIEYADRSIHLVNGKVTDQSQSRLTQLKLPGLIKEIHDDKIVVLVADQLMELERTEQELYQKGDRIEVFVESASINKNKSGAKSE